jgi:hypothetical protein
LTALKLPETNKKKTQQVAAYYYYTQQGGLAPNRRNYFKKRKNVLKNQGRKKGIPRWLPRNIPGKQRATPAQRGKRITTTTTTTTTTRNKT